MTKSYALPKWQRSLSELAATVTVVAIVATLYWAQAVFIPVGMALFLTFLLTPMVRALQRLGAGRAPSVIIVVVVTAFLAGGTLWIVGRELKELLGELPDYSSNITDKIKSIRALSAGSERLGKMVDEVGGALKSPPPSSPDQAPKVGEPDAGSEPAEKPAPVVLQPGNPPWLEKLPAYLSSAFESLASLALALVLVIFMLLKREDLRNRFLRLVGQGRMSSTTKAVDDAGQRISRYLLMQAIVNGSFGLALTLGLLVIGVEYAVLWGFLAAALRYVPYVGAWIAAAFPVLLSLATIPSWWAPLEVIGLVLTLELTTANVLEPLLYGQSMGVSAVAQLVSAAFWAFLWGPIGLVLSAPLTVVLLVLGKNVPQLEFLDVLLGDEPPLEPAVAYYQRLLARDQDDAAELVLQAVKSSNPEEVYDQLLVPALCCARRDHERDDLTDADQQFVFRTTRDVLDDLGARESSAEPAPESSEEPVPDAAPVVRMAGVTDRPRVQMLACPARDEADRLALLMLQQLLDPVKWAVEVTAVETLTSELLATVAQESRSVVCIASLPPGGLAHARYLCKRFRAQSPRIKIIVGRWGLRGNVAANQEELREAGADMAATTLLETRSQLETWHSILAQGHCTTRTRAPA
jgi:predicted PurR-regulated permease PerM